MSLSSVLRFAPIVSAAAVFIHAAPAFAGKLLFVHTLLDGFFAGLSASAVHLRQLGMDTVLYRRHRLLFASLAVFTTSAQKDDAQQIPILFIALILQNFLPLS